VSVIVNAERNEVGASSNLFERTRLQPLRELFKLNLFCKEEVAKKLTNACGTVEERRFSAA
jgi:hypothetical protein